MLGSTEQMLVTLEQLYLYLDSLFEQDVDSDTLFASGYLRGLIASAATDFVEEKKPVTPALIQGVSDKIRATKSELSPQDSVIVSNFWLSLQDKIVS